MIWGYPTTLSIEPTTSCNLRCPQCPSGLRSFSRPTGMLDPVLFSKIIEQFGDYITYLHLYFQGEPYLHPQFLDLVKIADEKGIFTSTSTNAHYLSLENVDKTLQSGLKKLIVSMDGTTQEVYENYRIGGQLNKVVEGLSQLIRARKVSGLKYPRIVLQFLVTGKNENQIPALYQWAEKMGVDEVQLKSTQIYDYENGSNLIPKNLAYSRYRPTISGKWELSKKIENKCWRMWQGAVITWDGKMVPCCFDKDASFVMGNVNEESMKKIWRNPIYRKFRGQLLDDRTKLDICKNCTE
jgi:radical SAM protein with 4Fe4S-binding SPASM domain